MARNDNRTAAKDVRGKRDVSYPTGSLDHPKVIETPVVRQGSQPKSFLEPHDNVTKYPNAKLIGQKESPGDNTDNNAERVYETLPGPILTGQHFDKTTGLVSVFTEQKTVAGANLGDDFTEITPIDAITQEVRVESPPSSEDILAYSIAGPGMTSFQLPRTLTGIVVVFNKSEGNGSNINNGGAAASSGTSGGLNFSPSSSAQGSASVIADIQPIIVETDADNVPTTEIHFFMASSVGSVPTTANVLTRLAAIMGASVSAWPRFKPKPVIMTASGQHVSLSASASSHHSDHWSADNLSASVDTGKGLSRENGITINSTVISPTIHAAFDVTHADGSISGGILTFTATTTVSATANLPAIIGSGPAPSFVAVENTTDVDGDPISATATASVTPANIPATTITAIPTSGLYLKEMSSSPAEWDGYVSVHCAVVNFSFFA